MERVGRYAVVLAVLAALVAGCGGSGRVATMAAQAAPPSPSPALAGPVASGLSTSSDGPMTCTVYEAGFATQVIFASQALDVRAECRAWTSNKAGEGFLWGYQPATAAAPAQSRQICYLMDPQRIVAARVVEATGFRSITVAQAARGSSACTTLRAFGWSRHGGAPHRSRP